MPLGTCLCATEPKFVETHRMQFFSAPLSCGKTLTISIQFFAIVIELGRPELLGKTLDKNTLL